MRRDDLGDDNAAPANFIRRMRRVERRRALERASITNGPGVDVRVPDGLKLSTAGAVKLIVTRALEVMVPEGIKLGVGGALKAGVGGAIEVDVPEGVKLNSGGSIKAGAAEMSGAFGGHIKSGGTSIGSDGIIRNDGGKIGMGHDVEMAPGTGVKAGAAEISDKFGGIVKSGGTSIGADGVIRNDDGSIKLGHRVDPLNGVLMTWGGARHTIEQVAGWLQGDINSVSTTANAAKSGVDNHGPRIGALEGDVAALESSSNGKASQSSVNALTSKLNEVIDALNDLESFVRSQHPSKPIRPPIVKG